MQIQGKIKLINPEQVVSDKFKKREIVVETSDQYPQAILIQFTQDKCSILDKYAVGQEVTVHINLRGREWTAPDGVVKYFNTIEGWRIESGAAQHTPEPSAATDKLKVNEDGLPF
jgi:hypothetical protein